MSTQSPNLTMPYILPSQAQKHVTHNEALDVLDAVVQAAIIDQTTTYPPTTPAMGDTYIIGDSATDSWIGRDRHLVFWQGTGWVFVSPKIGWRVWDKTASEMIVFDGSVWAPLAGPLQNLEFVGINATADTTNRLSVAADATLLNHEGADHQLKINKASTANTASLVFQSNWVGKTEIGLTGNDNLSINYSDDGITWNDGVSLDSANGHFGVGTATPLRELHISGTKPHLRLQDAAGTSGSNATAICEFYDSTTQMGWLGFSSGSGHMHLRNLNVSGDIRMVGGTNFVISASGKVGIGTVSPSAKLHVLGDVKCTSLTETSDQRMKTHIKDAPGTNSILDGIRIVQYDWTNGDGHVPYGLVAQELAQVLPDAVVQGDDTAFVDKETLHWGVRQAPLVAMLIKEVQSLRQRIAKLEAQT